METSHSDEGGGDEAGSQHDPNLDSHFTIWDLHCSIIHILHQTRCHHE